MIDERGVFAQAAGPRGFPAFLMRPGGRIRSVFRGLFLHLQLVSFMSERKTIVTEGRPGKPWGRGWGGRAAGQVTPLPARPAGRDIWLGQRDWWERQVASDGAGEPEWWQAGEARPEPQWDGGAGSRPIRVLLVDDHQLVRAGLADLLSQEAGIELAGEAANGREAIERAAETDPDVVVMDLSMPVMDGVEATRWLAWERPKVRIVGLSMHTHQDMAQMMLKAGASAYVTKGGPPAELIAAVHDLGLGDGAGGSDEAW